MRPIAPGSDFSFEILRNDAALLTVAVSAEGCGAYCEHFTRYYNYDGKTGRPLTLPLLMSRSGLRLLLDSLVVRKREEIESFVKKTKEGLQGKKLSSDDREYYEEMFSLYEECLERSDSIKPDFADDMEFTLTSTTLTVFLDRCSAHVNRNADELDEFAFEFDLAEWRESLSRYGRELAGE